MFFSYVLVAFFLAALISWGLVRIQKRNKYNFPEGPAGLPILGNILQLDKNGHRSLCQWADQYGPFYTLNLFGRKALVLNDLESMKNAFGTPASTGKLKNHIFSIVLKHIYGVVQVVKSEAVEQRKFFVKALRQTTPTTPGSQYEVNTLQEANKVCNEISERLRENQTSFSLVQLLHIASFKTIWSTTAGKALINEGPSMYSIFLELGQSTAVAARLGLIVIPILKIATYIVPSYRQLALSTEKYFQKIKLNFKMATENSSYSEKNIFTAYKEKVDACEDPQSTFYGDLGLLHSYSTIMSLFIGSVDTVSTMLNWVIFYLTSHPNVQQKLHAEIDEIIGKETPGFIHKQKMPYLQAIILEGLRFSSMFPFGLLHELVDDVQFNKYKLSKGTILIPNLYYVHNDKLIWGDPENFRPERFLKQNENNHKIKINNELKQYVVAFQVGKRVCIGDVMAKDILFLFTAKLFQKFHLKPDEKHGSEEYIKPEEGFILRPANIEVCISERV